VTYQRTVPMRIFRGVGVTLILVFTVFPVAFLFASAFKHPAEIFQFPPSLIFRPTLQNFFDLPEEAPAFLMSLRNSAIVALTASILTVILAVPAGYALSRHRRRFLHASAFFMLLVRMYPPIVLTVPLFPVFSAVGLVDNLWALILLYSALFVSLCTWLMKVYMDEVPVELEEAATIDGANSWQRLTRIILPLSVHGVVATAVFVSIFSWKEYTFAYIFTGARTQTAPVILDLMLTPLTTVSWGPIFAASTLQLFPILVFVWLIQTYLTAGMKTGGVKE